MKTSQFQVQVQCNWMNLVHFFSNLKLLILLLLYRTTNVKKSSRELQIQQYHFDVLCFIFVFRSWNIVMKDLVSDSNTKSFFRHVTNYFNFFSVFLLQNKKVWSVAADNALACLLTSKESFQALPIFSTECKTDTRIYSTVCVRHENGQYVPVGRDVTG